MESFRNDVRVAVRSLLKARGYTASALLTLAFGIALAIVVLSVVNAYLVRSLPYPAADRLYSVIYARQGEDQPDNLETLDWASLADVVEHPIAWDLDVFYILGGDGAFSERAPGAWVTPGFMSGLGIRPALGRGFGPNEFLPGAPQVTLISHDLWMRRFGGDSGVIGRRFDAYVSDRPRDPAIFTIVGVLPAEFWHLNPYTQILTPLRAAPTHTSFACASMFRRPSPRSALRRWCAARAATSRNAGALRWSRHTVVTSPASSRCCSPSAAPSPWCS